MSDGTPELERFRAVVARRLGLWFEDARTAQLEEVLRRRSGAAGVPVTSYVAALEAAGGGAAEVRALAGELTVPETYFFRNVEQFRAFAEIALPDRCRERAGRTLRVLSAGCASGEEPYTLAILLRERAAELARCQVWLGGVDVSPAALERAHRACYSRWSLRETPPEVERRWFRAGARELELAPEIRGMVELREASLIEDDPLLWSPGSLDVVFCRNVLMYLSPEHQRSVVGRIACALAPGGYLFLGHAENLRGLSQDFHLRQSHGTFYYQRRADRPGAGAEAPAPAGAPQALAALEAGTSWVDAIRRASERVYALASEVSGPPGTAAGPAPGWDLGPATDLLREERFADALAHLGALPPASARDRDVLLLRAALLAQQGALAEAEAACRSLLAVDELSAGARYLAALCREGSGDLAGAVEEDRAAVYLDPGFAMPRLHLGLIARRSGDGPGARRELGEALVLLQREDPARILLFGGGFSRDALAELCRTELARCGSHA